MAQVARIADDSSYEEVLAALQEQDYARLYAILSLVGGPTGVAPGEAQTVGAVLEPGMHVLICFVTSADGVPHLAKGMISQLEVTDGAAAASCPPATPS